MRDRITATLRRGMTAFAAFTAGQKAMVVVAVLALAIGGYFFATWAAQPSYAPLFSNLAGSDASAIVDKLTADGVPYQLTDGGGTIMVPKDKVYAERIKISGQGLPAQSDAGYALLDKQGAMTSEFMQQVGYQRALEGELAKTIKSIDGVTAATVHLAIPKKDVYTDDKQKPTASVLVATSAGRKLTAEQVQSVVHLVASSVAGLDPDRVTVAGSDGRILSTSGDSSATAGDARSRQSQDFEQRLNSALQRMLDQALGPGHSVVQVTADLDFDATQTTTQRYVGDQNTPALSESKKNETYSGTGTPVGGVLGPDNIQVPNGTGGTGQYSQTQETRNNAVGMVTEVRRSAPGAVRKLAVAVLIDSKVAGDAEAARLQQLVASAAGLDAARGDTLAVSSLKFDSTVAKQAQQDIAAAKKADSDAQLRSWIESGSVAAGVLVLLLFAWLSSRRRKKLQLRPEERAQLEEMQAALEEAQARLALAGGEEQAAIEAGNPQMDAALQMEGRRKELLQLIEKQPDDVAQLLRGWLADRRS